MIVGLVGLLSGYNGHFEFKSGDEYKEDVPYVAMRVMLATFGVLMVPLAWYTAKELGFSNRASHLTTIMVLCGTFSYHGSIVQRHKLTRTLDVAWLCISRFILLDSMLLFFTVLTVFCLTRFHTERGELVTRSYASIPVTDPYTVLSLQTGGYGSHLLVFLSAASPR
jgi:dolichyl-phosphate-mannose-protein mannosyltransferase